MATFRQTDILQCVMNSATGRAAW